MRYTLLLFFFVIGCQFLVQAQDSSKKLKVSLQFGMNISSFSKRIGPYGDGESDFYREFQRFSPKAGIGLHYSISQVYSIHTELNYATQGGSYRMKADDIVDIYDDSNHAYFYKNYQVDYFEIPLIFTVNLESLLHKDYDPKKAFATVSTGLAYSVNTISRLRENGFEEKGNSSGPYTSVREEYEVQEIGYGQNNISYLFDFGINFYIKDVPSFVILRYQRTMRDVYRIDELNSDNMKTKMGTFLVSFGVMLTDPK